MRFGMGVRQEAPRLLAEGGFDGYALLTTKRALEAVPELAHHAATIVQLPGGRVDELSADFLEAVGDRPVVALGGGRVVDTAKAIAGARGQRCAALPTTLSGAELTPFHRLPRGVEGARMIRPALVIADPELMTSQPPAMQVASAMNALAHAFEALYTPLANPVCESVALRAATLIARGLDTSSDLDSGQRTDLAAGAVLAGYASGCTGVAVHHAVCQTIVRTAGAPHAETNAVMLHHSARLMVPRAPAVLWAFAVALGEPEEGDPAPDAHLAADILASLAYRNGYKGLGQLGVGEEHVATVAAAAVRHPALQNTPEPPDEAELATLVRNAL